MNKIVLEHYPVQKLPKDIRDAIGNEQAVTLTIERDRRTPLARDEFVRRLREKRQLIKPAESITPEEAVARIRALRDEWDD